MEKIFKSCSVFTPEEAAKINTPTLKKYLIKLIPKILMKISDCNKENQRHSNSDSAFDLQSQEIIKIENFVFRLIKYTSPESGTIIYALNLIDKLLSTKRLYLSDINMHKIFLASLIISFKLYEDKIYEIGRFMYASGLSSQEIAFIEYEFIIILDYDLKVKDERYYQYLSHCIKSSNQRSSC